MTAQVSEELLAEFADVMSVVQVDTPGSLYSMLKETFRQTGMTLAMKAAEPLAQGDECDRIFAVLRDWRLSTMAQEDEPTEGYPLVDAVSTPGGTIASGEEELGEIAAAISAALVRSKPTISATQTRGSCSVAALRPVARDYWVRPLVSVGDWVIVQDANDAEADPWVVSREKWDRARTLAKDEERHA